MADGSVTIQVKADARPFEKKLQEIDNYDPNDLDFTIKGLDDDVVRIKEIRQEIEQLNEMGDRGFSIRGLKTEISGYSKEVRSLTADFSQLDKMRDIAENRRAYQNYISTPKTANLSGFKSYDSQQISNFINDYVSNMSSAIQQTDKLEGKTDKVAKNIKKASSNSKETSISLGKVGSGVTDILKKVGRWALAIFSIRSAYNLIRQATSNLAGQDEQVSANLDYIKNILTNAIAPVLTWVVNVIGQIISLIGQMIYSLTGFNILSKAGAKNLAGASGSAKELSKSLAGFDEMNILQDNSSSGGGGGGGVSANFGATSSLINALQNQIQKLLANQTTKEILASFKRTFNNVKEIGQNTAKAIKIAFNDSTIGKDLLKTFLNIQLTTENITKRIKDWTISDSYQNFWNGYEKILATITHWVEVITRKVKELTQGGLGNSLSSLLNILGTVMAILGDIFEILKPIVDLLINAVAEALNGQFQIISDVTNVINDILEVIKYLFDWIRGDITVEEFVEKIKTLLADLAYNFLMSILDVIKTAISEAVMSILTFIDTLIYGIGNLFGANLELEQSTIDLTTAHEDLADAQDDARESSDALRKAQDERYSSELTLARAIENEEEKQRKLTDAQNKAGMTAEQLLEKMNREHLSYNDLDQNLRELYTSYYENQDAIYDVEVATENNTNAIANESEAMKNAKADEEELIKAKIRDSLQTAIEREDYDKFRETLQNAYEKGKFSAEDCYDAIQSASRETGKKTDEFTNGLSTGLREALNINRYTGLANGFKNWWNGIFNSLSRKININASANMSGYSSFHSGGVTKLATGSLINLPGRGVPISNAIGGEAGQEGIIPLTDTQAMQKLGEAIGRYITINNNITTKLNSKIISREMQRTKNEQDFAFNR